MADTHSATVFAHDFYRAALNASLFAGKDDTLPVLCTVRFSPGKPGTIRAESTNRYVACQETLTLVDPDHDTDHEGHADCPAVETDLDVTLDVKSLVKITKMLKSLEESPRYGMADGPLVVITWTEDARHASLTLTRHIGPDQTLKVERTEGEWPKLDRFWESHRELGDRELPCGFQDWKVALDWLAVLAKVESDQGRREYSPAELSFGEPGKPVVVKIGDSFKALVMPIRN